MAAGATVLWIIVGVIVVAIAVILIVVMKKRSNKESEPTLDPPYGRKNFPDPTTRDPQVPESVDRGDGRLPTGPDNIRNPDVDNKAPGPSTPRRFQPPGPPRE